MSDADLQRWLKHYRGLKELRGTAECRWSRFGIIDELETEIARRGGAL
jgi:hypothetical protein